MIHPPPAWYDDQVGIRRDITRMEFYYLDGQQRWVVSISGLGMGRRKA